MAQWAIFAAPESSSTVTSAPLVKLGGSLTPVTVILKVCTTDVSTPPLAVPPSSLSLTLTVATPKAFLAGVKVSVPVAGSIVGSSANNSGLSTVTTNVAFCPDSLAGPT